MTSSTLTRLPHSLRRVLERCGVSTDAAIDAWRAPSLDTITPTHHFPHMAKAVARLRLAIENEEPIGIYADRDVDGLTGLAIFARSLRSLGAVFHWGSPLNGRGLQRPVLERLIAQRIKILVLIDCGTGEMNELTWLEAQGIEVIVADHHRMGATPPPAFAWIHPWAIRSHSDGSPTASDDRAEVPAGCVMAFQLARGLWQSFAGDDAGRMDYFLYAHLDLLCLGILADQVPLTGDNRTFVWHGLRRLATTRKTGLSLLMRFFRLLPRSGPVSVREASWQIIPLLNAAGRLGKPQWTVELLMTEDPFMARQCLDHLLALNTERRAAQDVSLERFKESVLSQCAVETDCVIVARAQDLEPSVTGLAAQALARHYGKPAFLFVEQGEETVGSGRGIPGIDLFAWIEEHRDLLVKFGGHEGAVGLTLRTADFSTLRAQLLESGVRRAVATPLPIEVDGEIPLHDLDSSWWEAYLSLEPFGTGFTAPVFDITHIEEIISLQPRATKNVLLKGNGCQLEGDSDIGLPVGRGPWTLRGTPRPSKTREVTFTWNIEEVRRHV